MNKVSFLILFFLMVLLAIPFVPNFVFGGISNSTYDFFNATNLTRFNWTTSLIFVGSYKNTTTVNINNKTTGLYPDYSQDSGANSYLTNAEMETCFPEYESPNYNVTFVLQRGDGTYTNFTSSLNESEVENFTLSVHPFCPPGLYSGYFMLTRVGNSSDNISVSATLDIPISVNNTFDVTSNKANFRGTMVINDSYHSYYFNTSEVPENITGLTIKLNSTSDDVDLFLFDDSGILQGKSIERSTTDEQIIDVNLPSSPAMWEIRVYGNVNSGYRGYLYLSSLNTTNTSLDFGDLDVNITTNETYNVTNLDDRTLLDVNDYFEIYHVDRWNLENTSKDFTNFLVPTFGNKIKVMIEWTDETGKNITDWDLYLTDPSGNLIGNSSSKFINTNATNATREEFVVFSGPFNSSNEGFWNISVRNQTNSTIPMSYYNITAYIWMDESNWVSTNFTDGFSFNSSGLTNDTYVVGLNLTIPETQVLDGEYDGFIKYNSSEGWATRLPISFNVSTGTLVVNNSLNNATIRLKDNIGFNRLGSSVLTLNVTFNNTGSYPIYYTNLTSNYTLTQDSNSNINFTVDDWPSNPINAGTKGRINISVSINTTLTGNDEGIYRGWIFLNTTNTTLNSSSYPYKTFNLSLEVNLTDKLDLQLISVNTSDTNQTIENISSNESVTFVTRVFLANSTQILDTEEYGRPIYAQNFTNPLFTETNYSKQYTLTDVIRESGGATFLCRSNKCYVNATPPTGMIGGRYRASIGVQYNTSECILTGNGTYDAVVVNNTGFVMSTNETYGSPDCSWGSSCTTEFEMNNGTSRYFFVNVTNYGPLSAQTTLNYSENCDGYSIAATKYSNCGSSSKGDYEFTITPAGYSTSCLLWWTISVDATQNATSGCPGYIVNGSGSWFNPNGITITISTQVTPTTTATTSTTSDSQDGTTDGTTAGDEDEEGEGESIYLEIKTYPSTVSIEQGKNKTESVLVKNINDTVSQTVTLTVTGIDSSWYDILINNKKIDPGKMYTYYVTFNIPDNATVKDYACKFKASSSLDTVSKDFTLEVTPGPEMQENINVTLSDYESEISDLETIINQSRDQGKNTTVAESKFKELKDKFKQALNYRDTGDYKSAYELFDDIDTLLNETRAALEEAGIPTGGFLLGDWWNWGKWIVVAVVGVVVIVLGYLFWPTAGYEPGKQFVIKTKREVVKDQLSEKYRKLKEKWSKIREKEEQKEQEQVEQQSATTGESQ